MFIIFYLTVVTFALVETIKFGYDAQKIMCPLGIADCLPTQFIPCEFGYFLYVDALNKNNCLPCPYFQNQDNLNILCGDCLEDPYNWQQSRACTYNYRIQTGEPGEVYLRENTQKTIYYIQEKPTTGVNPKRPVYFKYELSICEGCSVFCFLSINQNNGDEVDENNNGNMDENNNGNNDENIDENNDEGASCLDNNQQDNIFNGILCLDHYYYIEFECRECQPNCKTCNPQSCQVCNDGYYLNSQSSCTICQPDCMRCEYSDSVLLCLQCSRSGAEYLVESTDFRNCITCEYQCARCEYISYDYYKDYNYLEYGTRDQYFDPYLNYLLRCRQCVSPSQFISYDGETCEDCQIKNCQTCYYELDDVHTTLEYDFIPKMSPKSKILCHICNTGFYRKEDKTQCIVIPNPPPSTCKSFNKAPDGSGALDNKCTICDNNILDLQIPDNPLCITSKQCSKLIKNCEKCFIQKRPEKEDSTISFCTQCIFGYYPDIFSGKCLSCPVNCKTCWQYTPSYNFTSYLQTYKIISQDDFTLFSLESLQDAKCTQCQEGFSLYGNQCMGCTSNCKNCYQDNDKAYCYNCDNPDKQSILADMSECQECPAYCAACRDRIDTDPIVNRYFNPVSDILYKYSRMCYKLIKTAEADCVFLDNKIGLPVKCVDGCSLTMQYKCFNKDEVSLTFDCDTDLGKYNSAKSKVSIITFQDIDSFKEYQNYNDNTIKELTINLKLTGDKKQDGNICQFKKESQFQFSFRQNVYSLQKVILNINLNSETQQKWIVAGLISFKGVSQVNINNIQIEYFKEGKNAPKEFGLYLKSSDESQFILNNIEFVKEKNKSQKLLIIVENPVNFTMSNVKISNIETKDQVVYFNYSLSSLSYQDIKLNNVELIDCNYNFSSIITFSNIAPSLFLKVSNLKITQGNFISSSIIRSNFQINSLYYQIDKLTLMFNYFSNSTLFQLANLQTSQQFSNVDILYNRFVNSKVFLMNSFQFSQFYFDSNILQNNSIIFQTVKELKLNDQLQSSLLEYKFDKIKIVNTNCYSINCLMIMSTPINTYSIITMMTISNLQISNIGISDISIQNTFLTTSALINWNTFSDIKLSNIQFDNLQGLTIFYISTIKSLTITTLKYDWSQSNYQQQKVLPINNLIPTTTDCSDRKVAAVSFSYILFFIYQFSSFVNISDVLIQRQLLIDASIFYIQSYDVAYQNTTNGNNVESITLSGLQILNNSLVSNKKGLFSGCINIQSNQIQMITIDNSNFQSNHLQQIISKQTIVIVTLFQISSPRSTIKLTNFLSEYNRAIKSDYGLIKIDCQKITINNATFRYTNIIDRLWVKRIEPNQITTDDDIKSFFEINSYGTIMDLTTIIGTISHISIYYTYGIQAGIKLTTIGTSNIQIKNSDLENIFSSLELKHSSIGGSFFIDSTLSNLNCIISNLSIVTSRVRQTGGCIYVLASNKNQNITIKKSYFQECQALDTSFMRVDYLADALFQQVTLEEVNVIDNNIDKLISVIPQIQVFEFLYFLQSSSVYTQTNGRLIIGDSLFSQINYTSALSLNQLKFLYINKLSIQKGFLFYNPLLSLSLLQSGGQVYIGNLDIIEFNETIYTFTTQYNCSSLIPSSFTYIIPEQNCDQIQLFQEQLDEMDNNDEIYEYYDENLEAMYNRLTSNTKYIPMYIQKAKFDSLSNIIDIVITLNSQLVSCVMNNILYLSRQLNLDNFSSLFYISEVNDNQLVQIKKISLVQNQCLQCKGGLLQIRSVSDTNTKELISITEFFCQYNIVGYYGCTSLVFEDIIMDVTLLSEIIDESIQNNRLLQATDMQSLNHTIIIESYQCTNNLARAGTCLNLRGVTAIVQNSQFSSNNASLVGGSIYFENLGVNNMYLLNNQFINNQAQIGGAIYLSNYQLSNTDKLGLSFDKNSANEGGTDIQELTIQQTLQLINIPFASQTYLSFDGDETDDGAIDNTSVVIKDNVTLEYHKTGNYPQSTNLLILPSGQRISKYLYFYESTQEQVPFEWVFRIINLNRFGDVVRNSKPDETCEIDGRIQNQSNYNDQLSFTNNFTVPTKVFYNPDKGGYDMDDLILIFDPQASLDLYLELRFTCNSVELPIYNTKPPYQILGYNRNYELYARIRTFPCQIGEAYDSQQCKACQKSDLAYSVEKDSVLCKQMNRLTMRTVSPIGINLIQGYWRPIFQNDDVEYCVNLPNNCNGGWIPGNPSCYTGHVGALCESCDIYMIQNDERWAPSDPYKCGLCKDSEQFNLIIIIAISTLTMISTIMSVKGTFQALQLQIVEDVIKIFGKRLKSDSSNLATMVQTLTNYFQIVQIVMTFQLQIPSGVETATQTAGNPTGSMAYSLDCLLIKISDIELLYFKMVWALIMPLCYLGVIILGYLIICIIGITKFSQSIIYTALIYIFLYMHPTLVQGFISQASVRTISNLPWVKADVGYRYDSDVHNYWMARFIGPMLIVWVIALPAIFMFLVWLKRNKLDLKQTKMTLGYFYREYSKDSYLWEFVKIFQKEFFVIILVYYEEYVIVKGLLIVLVLFIYGWYQVSVSPYGSKKLNEIDRYSTMVCAATLCLGVLMYGAQLKDYYYLQVIILIILALLNLWFIIMCILEIFQGYLIQFKDQLDIVREQLLKAKPELKEKKGFIGKLLIHRGNMNKRVKVLWELLKTRTIAAVKITKLSQEVSFEDAFDYVIENNIDASHIGKVSQKKQFEKLRSQENE